MDSSDKIVSLLIMHPTIGSWVHYPKEIKYLNKYIKQVHSVPDFSEVFFTRKWPWYPGCGAAQRKRKK